MPGIKAQYKPDFVGPKRPRGRPRTHPKKEPEKPKRGRPTLPPELVDRAKALYLEGNSNREVAAAVGIHWRTVIAWKKRYQWDADLADRRALMSRLEHQAAKLAAREPTASVVDRLAKVARAMDRLKKHAPKPKAIPVVRQAVSAATLDQVLAPEFGLYPYQRSFLESEARFRCILKARQVGFSYVLGLAVLLGAMAGRDQLVISASELQSQIVAKYARAHAARLDVATDDDGKSLKEISVRGATIRALPANFRTVQGFPGDVWLDEFAWHHNPKRIWDAVVPSITQVGGRVTLCSTPFLPGSLFWQIAVNDNGRWPQFERTTIDIHEAVRQGMPLPGGIEELRGLFDSESWAMLYECQWAEDGSALLPWELLHEIATVSETRLAWDGPVDVGVDVGQANDRFVQACVGTELDAYRLLWYQSEKGLSFEAMRGACVATQRKYLVRRMAIDRTGIGRQLAEELVTAYPSSAIGRDFSRPAKERWALNLLKLAEDGRLRIPNDPYLISRLHAVKKRTTGTGITYDAARDSEGHADEFWALALAVDGHSKADSARDAVVEVWS